MTICVGLKVRDGIVFAADSAVSMMATTAAGEVVVQNVWNHGIKVYNLHKDLPVVAMSNGAGSLGSASVNEIAKYLRLELTNGGGPNSPKIDPTNYEMKDIADRSAEFLKNFISTETIEFFVGGYGAADPFGEIWKFSFEKGVFIKPTLVVAQEIDSYIVWGGSGGYALHRLVLGRDARLPELLAQEGLAEDVIAKLNQNLDTQLVNSGMPIQDVINLSSFLVDVAKGYSTFAAGANSVGGETDIAAVTKHEGFKWIRRKQYYSVDINRREQL